MTSSTISSSGVLSGPNAAVGPLVVSATNPRYFAVSAGPGTERAVYLTGSHIWNNLQDGLGPGPACASVPEQNDYDAYLTFLDQRGHNFIRLWRWEQFKSQAAGGNFHLCMMPQPWPRVGAGGAKDGKPRFDLSRFDPAYFDRLRQRVIAAGNRGIYVAVMLFDGWGLHLSPAPDNVEGHPFHAANNINGIGIRSIVDYQVLPLDPRVQALQEAYITKVVDTLHDVPNVLWEVANESSGGGTVDEDFATAMGMSEIPNWGDSTAWQYWVIDLVKRYERERGYEAHPIGMTMQFPVADQTRVNAVLYASQADWISPGYDLMDFGIVDVVKPLDPSLGVPSFESYEAARYAMGDTRRYAERMNLIRMEPRGDLASTGFALAHVGREYLVLQPDEAGGSFTIEVATGTYAVEWFSVTARETVRAAPVTVGDTERRAFVPPFAARGPAVLYLSRELASGARNV